MTLGEIKVQTLQLMGFEERIDEDTVAHYEENSDWAPLLQNVWSAVNRCLADLAAKRVYPLCRTEVTPTSCGAVCRLDVSGVKGIPERLIACSDGSYDTNVSFVYEDEGTLAVSGGHSTVAYTLLYRPFPIYLSENTGNGKEIALEGKALPPELAAVIPYFVKSEIYVADEPNEAAAARNLYEAAVEQYVASRVTDRQGTVQTVYGLW